MLRNIGAVIAGLIVGSIVNMALIMLNATVLFPMPDGLDMSDTAAFNAYIADLPSTAFILVLAAHLGQAFVGGWLAARLGASRPVLLAMIVGALTLLGGIMNAMQIDLPMWMYIEMPLYLVLAFAAGKIEEKRRGAAGTDAPSA